MDNIKSMTEIAKANGIEMILCSVLPVTASVAANVPTKSHWFNHKLQAYATEQGLVYVDYYTPGW